MEDLFCVARRRSSWDEATGSTRQLTPLERTGVIVPVEVSPDGKRVAYANAGKLWTISLAGGLPYAIADSPGLRCAWSPNGAWIAFQTQQGLYKVPSQGGAGPVQMFAGGATGFTHGVGWAGGNIYFAKDGGLFRMAEGGGAVTEVGKFPGANLMAMSGDGATLQLLEDGSADNRMLMVDARTGAVVKRITIDTDGVVRSVSIHPDGKRMAVWVHSTNLDLWMLEGFPRPAVGWARWLDRKWLETK